MNAAEQSKPLYRLEPFEGPLETLLGLIQKNRVDIYDIPISLILEQFLEHIQTMRELDLEVTSEFVEYAATLMYIKSRQLLPAPDDGEEPEDPRAMLVAALLEYQRAQQVALYLEQLQQQSGERFARRREDIPADKVLPDNAFQVELLRGAFEGLFRRQGRKTPPPAEAFARITSRARVTIFERAISVLRRLKREEAVEFDRFFEGLWERDAVIATFLALLELVKTARIRVIEADESIKITLTDAKSG